MGRRDKSKTRVVPEQDKKICGTICICQMTMVLSCVSFVYLSVAIYFPSHKAFNFGMNPTPVMCQTVNSTLSKNCTWASCGEWCLTKTTGFCPQIYVTVRQNGTNVAFENCTRTNSVSCPPANEDVLKKFNCNNPSECVNLTGIFKCRLGHCSNLSDIYYCRHETEKQIYINSDTDNLKLNGLFDCNKARCLQIRNKFKCERYCNKITTAATNVYLKNDNNLFTAECQKSVAFNRANGPLPGTIIDRPTEIWSREKRGGVLFLSCTNVARTSNHSFRAWDCINGTIVDNSRIPPKFMNFSQFWNVYDTSAKELDGTGQFLPMQHYLTVYNKSRLYINLEGCVNTLRGECKEFTRTHGSNGSDDVAASRFQCYYNKNDSSLALARFNLNKTWLELMIAVCVPGTLFIVSFVTLMIITQSVRVGDDARMRCKWCKNGSGAAGAHNREAITDCNVQYETIGDVKCDKIKKDKYYDNDKNNVAMQPLNTSSIIQNKEESKLNLLDENNASSST